MKLKRADVDCLVLEACLSLVAFATANQAVGNISFEVALKRHRANMAPMQAREVLGMEPARVRPRRVVRDA